MATELQVIALGKAVHNMQNFKWVCSVNHGCEQNWVDFCTVTQSDF